jgi:periplasmic divalent cation tolerance protein
MRCSPMIERQIDTEDPILIVLTTFPDLDAARQIGTEWVESQLAACVNLLPGAESIYRWEGRTERSGEVLALVKTARSRLDQLAEAIRSHHPYELPELLVLEPSHGSTDYLAWVRAACAAAAEPT